MNSESENYFLDPKIYGVDPNKASEQYKNMNKAAEEKRATLNKDFCFNADYNAETKTYSCPICKNKEAGTSRDIGHHWECMYYKTKYCQQNPTLKLPTINPSTTNPPLNLPPINPTTNLPPINSTTNLPQINPSQNFESLTSKDTNINPYTKRKNTGMRNKKLGGTQKRKRAKKNQKKKTRRYRRKSVRRNSN